MTRTPFERQRASIPIVRATSTYRFALGSDGSDVLHNDNLAIVLCERGSTVTIPKGVATLWCSVLGRAEVVGNNWGFDLTRGDIYVDDVLAQHDLVVSNDGICIGIAGSPRAWSKVRRNTLHPRAHSGGMPFPAIHRSRHSVCRRILGLARQCREAESAPSGNRFFHLIACSVDELQSEFVHMIERCPGSTWSRKRAVFLRLQRVRDYIAASTHVNLDVPNLALIANYSVSYFITTYRLVFGETPYASIGRQRLENASKLLRQSEMGVTEIAQATGFGTRQSFHRAMTIRFGISAQKFRDRQSSGHEDVATT